MREPANGKRNEHSCDSPSKVHLPASKDYLSHDLDGVQQVASFWQDVAHRFND
jgi:hypothetical protein